MRSPGIDIEIDDAAIEKIDAYVDLLLEFNRSMNLIGPLDRASIVDELIVDSLSAAALAPPAGDVVDVGTGAGLPGIPLAIVHPDARFTLVEPRRKRCTFLKIARRRLGLENVEIVAAGVEEVQRRFDYAVSKAFRPPAEWLAVASELVREGGIIVCLHATDEFATIEARCTALSLEVVSTATRTSLGAPPHEPERSVTGVRRRETS